MVDDELAQPRALIVDHAIERLIVVNPVRTEEDHDLETRRERQVLR
ncbi:MAG: hypothetical protein QM784_11060 [Polyangiaceae bacterium]